MLSFGAAFGFFLTWWGVFLMAALDTSMLFFLPFGIDALVIYLAARNESLFWLYPVLATAGSLAGAAVTYWIGRKLGEVGLLGFSFKPGTDDLRESPMVILAEALLGKGYALKIYDRNVSLARLVGANKQYIEEQIPHLSRHLSESIDQVIEESEVIVIGNGSPEFSAAIERCRPEQMVIDLVRIPLDFSRVQAQYDGICW